MFHVQTKVSFITVRRGSGSCFIIIHNLLLFPHKHVLIEIPCRQDCEDPYIICSFIQILSENATVPCYSACYPMPSHLGYTELQTWWCQGVYRIQGCKAKWLRPIPTQCLGYWQNPMLHTLQWMLLSAVLFPVELIRYPNLLCISSEQSLASLYGEK
jgi:hypothetical protein